MIISAKEAMRSEATRLEVYRLAVQNGFYNEGNGTLPYRGFQIMPDGEKFAVTHHGVVLIHVQSLHIAKVWIMCRVNNCGLAEANQLVQHEDRTAFCHDCGEYVLQPHDCHD